MHIALLTTDTQLANLLTAWLADEHHTLASYNKIDALTIAVGRSTFDLLILEFSPFDAQGKQALQWLRRHLDWPIPILAVTSRDDEDEVVRILLEGADDYMVRPVRRRELLARITAADRRARLWTLTAGKPVLEFEPYLIDPAHQTVARGGQIIKLTHKELELALFLFHNAGRALSRDYILEHVWGHTADLHTRTVDTHVSRLRNKLQLMPHNGWKLTGIYHRGYRLDPVAVAPIEGAQRLAGRQV